MRFSLRRVFPILLMTAGIFMLLNVAVPLTGGIIAVLLTPKNLLDPTAVSPFPRPIVQTDYGMSGVVDYSNAGSWFSAPADLPPPKNSPVGYFTVSLPRLKMDNITVEVNGNNLHKNAIHYPGTALPGEFGNSVIFGHSALPQFYRPGNPQTVFNPLTGARIGDEIDIKFDGVLYTYVVKKISQVDPTAVEVLGQKYDRRDLSLITCVPLGTYWHRLVVLAELTD